MDGGGEGVWGVFGVQGGEGGLEAGGGGQMISKPLRGLLLLLLLTLVLGFNPSL